MHPVSFGLPCILTKVTGTILFFSGTFHDWTLLLYGTAEPAQPSDTRHPPAMPTSSGSSLLGRATQQITSQVGRQRKRPRNRHRQQRSVSHSLSSNAGFSNGGGDIFSALHTFSSALGDHFEQQPRLADSSSRGAAGSMFAMNPEVAADDSSRFSCFASVH